MATKMDAKIVKLYKMAYGMFKIYDSIDIVIWPSSICIRITKGSHNSHNCTTIKIAMCHFMFFTNLASWILEYGLLGSCSIPFYIILPVSVAILVAILDFLEIM